jgi:hypothetical protein
VAGAGKPLNQNVRAFADQDRFDLPGAQLSRTAGDEAAGADQGEVAQRVAPAAIAKIRQHYPNVRVVDEELSVRWLHSLLTKSTAHTISIS